MTLLDGGGAVALRVTQIQCRSPQGRFDEQVSTAQALPLPVFL